MILLPNTFTQLHLNDESDFRVVVEGRIVQADIESMERCII